MIERLKALVAIAEAMVAVQDREDCNYAVTGVVVEVDERVDNFGVVTMRVFIDGEETEFSEPFEWKHGKWISALPD